MTSKYKVITRWHVYNVKNIQKNTMTGNEDGDNSALSG